MSPDVKEINNIVDYMSSVRHGNIRKLAMGQEAIVDVISPIIVSTRTGATITKGTGYQPIALDLDSTPTIYRARIETFEISKTYKITSNDLVYRKFGYINKIGEDFANFEVQEIFRRIESTEDVIFNKNPTEVENLKKLFDGLGKKVVILPSAKVVDLGKSFTLWVRNDLSIESFNNTVDMTLELTAWEHVGFSCEIS